MYASWLRQHRAKITIGNHRTCHDHHLGNDVFNIRRKSTPSLYNKWAISMGTGPCQDTLLSAQGTVFTLSPPKQTSLCAVPGHFVLTSPPGSEIMGNNPNAAASDITDLYLKFGFTSPTPLLPRTSLIHDSSKGTNRISRGLTRRWRTVHMSQGWGRRWGRKPQSAWPS